MPTENIVIDRRGRRFTLSQLLGKGGQGTVYAVKENQRVAVKILKARHGYEVRLREQIEFVRTLDLSGIPIARPLETLREGKECPIGYTMELATGMNAFAQIAECPKGETHPVEWYKKTGGLRRRLVLLAKLAEAVHRMHSKGLIYADLSPRNVLVSKSPEHNELLLIDADNLRYASSPANTIGTPKYMAPELARREGFNNTLTDAWSFAVLAYQTLRQVHPLLGDWVVSGLADLEDQALCGHLPWVDHPTDDRNRSSDGLPSAEVIEPKLAVLFQKTFVDSLMDPLQRPGLGAWITKLEHAIGITLRCPDCGSTYYGTSKQCPWCRYKRPEVVKAVIGVAPIVEPHISRTVGQYLIAAGQRLALCDKEIAGEDDVEREPKLEFFFDGAGALVINGLLGRRFRLIDSHMDHLVADARIPVINLKKGNPVRLVLHDGSYYQRIVTFTHYYGT